VYTTNNEDRRDDMSQLFWCAVCLFIGLLFPSLIYQVRIQGITELEEGQALKLLFQIIWTDIFGVITIIALGNGIKLL